jgi:hypothetical protein
MGDLDLLANASQVWMHPQTDKTFSNWLSIHEGKEVSNDCRHKLRVLLQRVSKAHSPRFIELKRRQLVGDRYFNEWLDGR